MIRTLTWPVTSDLWPHSLQTCCSPVGGDSTDAGFHGCISKVSGLNPTAINEQTWSEPCGSDLSVWFGPCGCRVLSLAVLRVSTTSIKTEQLCECLCVDTSMEPIDPSLWLIRTESPSVTRCAACLMFCSDTDPVSSQVSMMSSPLCAGHRWCLRWTSTVLTSGVRTEPELFNFKHQQHV